MQFQAEVDFDESATVDPLTEKLENYYVKPKKTDITVRVVFLAWAPEWCDASGGTTRRGGSDPDRRRTSFPEAEGEARLCPGRGSCNPTSPLLGKRGRMWVGIVESHARAWGSFQELATPSHGVSTD